MSTGGNLPYQLRPNKAVERLIFCDLLLCIDPLIDVSSGFGFEYIGFGGPQMEDFRLLHECFPKMKMISIEYEQAVMKRQKFNGPHTSVKYRNQTCGDFLNTYKPKNRSIIWLDYTKPSERPQQIQEFQSVLRRVQECSVIKITLNAAAASIPGGNNDGVMLLQKRLETFIGQFGRFFPTGLEESGITTKYFPLTLLQVVKMAASESLRDRRNWRFQPLTSAIYADGQIMLTVTGIVAPVHTINTLLCSPRLIDWHFTRLNWSEPIRIDVPELTMKERIFINQLLPKYEDDVVTIGRRLGYPIDSDLDESMSKLQKYIEFHLHYPQFGKVSL